MYYYPLPYFISKPGEAVELAPIIQVDDGYKEQGTFMLTTVRMGGANLFNYAWASWDDYMDIIPKRLLLAHYENEDEYTARQLQVMQDSQESAIIVAYQLANKTVHIENEGIIVERTSEGMPAEDILKTGDMITYIDQRPVETAEQLIKYVQSKEIGDTIEVTYLRNKEEQKATLTLAALPLTEEEQMRNVSPRAGIGVSILTKRSVSVEPPVEINTERIGGPSAGLMFSLEIYNQLTEEDITKGYRIAGTGRIDVEGKVGSIGGIHQKVVAADRARAAIFFAPNEEGAATANYQVALEAAQDIQTEMKVVPVDTIQDALDYLAKLPNK